MVLNVKLREYWIRDQLRHPETEFLNFFSITMNMPSTAIVIVHAAYVIFI